MILLPIEEIIGGVVTVSAGLILAWDRISKWKVGKTEKDMRTDILIHATNERDNAMRQRDAESVRAVELQTKNLDLEGRIRELRVEIDGLNNRLILLTELNSRLAMSLDSTRTRLETYLLDGSQSP